MKNSIRKVLHDSVCKIISNIISNIISYKILSILVIIFSILEYFNGWRQTIYQFIAGESILKNWLIFIFFILVIMLVIIIFILVIRNKILNKIHSKLTSKQWMSYTSDQLFNMQFQWNYSPSGKIVNINTFCPYCNFKLHHKRSKLLPPLPPKPPNVFTSEFVISPPQIEFECENCKKFVTEFNESYDSLESRVKLTILQNIENKFLA